MFFLGEGPVASPIGFFCKSHFAPSTQQDHSFELQNPKFQIYLALSAIHLVSIGLRNWYIRQQTCRALILAITMAEFFLSLYQNIHVYEAKLIKAKDVSLAYELLLLIVISGIVMGLIPSSYASLKLTPYKKLLAGLKRKPSIHKNSEKLDFAIETCGKTDTSIDKWEAATSSSDGGDSLFSNGESTSSSSGIYTAVQGIGTVMDEATWASRWKNHGSDWSDSSLSGRQTTMLDMNNSAKLTSESGLPPITKMPFPTGNKKKESEIKDHLESTPPRFVFGTIAKRKKSGSFWTKGARSSVDRKKKLLQRYWTYE